MKRAMTKRTKITLGVLVAVLLISVCFVTVALYAKKELSKPKFVLPEQVPLPSVSELPTDKADALAYAARLFDEVVQADDAEQSLRTDVSLDGEWSLPFAEADNAFIMAIRERAAGEIASLYTADAQTEQFSLNGAQARSFTASQGKTQDDGSVKDADIYFLSIELDPAFADTAAMETGDICRAVREKLSDALTVESLQITATDVSADFRIDRVTDQLLSADVTYRCRIRAQCRLTEAYGALLPQQTADVELPFTKTEHFTFTHYGACFTERAVAVRPGDMQSLPADVRVPSDASQDEFTLTFTPDVPDVLRFDDDGVMHVLGVWNTPVTVTMTLQYGGQTYTDSILVYITQWEVKSDA